MPKTRSWSDKQLIESVKRCYSLRSVLIELKLVPAGGNYAQVSKRIKDLSLPTTHFTGARWNAGKTYHTKSRKNLDELLVEGSIVQSYKLKQRLYEAGIKSRKCELCGWSKISIDGRQPLELDHINGNNKDNRIENLRILCPNCHSLQPTHRGKNKKIRYARVL